MTTPTPVVINGMTIVTVAPNKRLTVNVSGFTLTYVAGDNVYVPTFEVVYLKNAGVVVDYVAPSGS